VSHPTGTNVDPRPMAWLLRAITSNVARARTLFHGIAHARQEAKKLFRCGRTVLLADCGDGDVRILSGVFCHLWRMCLVCAALRRRRLVRKYAPAFVALLQANPSLKMAMVTLTVRNGPDLQDRVDHLLRSWVRLLGRRADARCRGRGQTHWARVSAGLANVEIERGQNSGEWHPHLHVLVLHTGVLDKAKLSDEWADITGDSYQIEVTSFPRPKRIDEDFLDSVIKRVLRYTVDLKVLTPIDAWEVHDKLRRVKLTRPFGDLIGFERPQPARLKSHAMQRFNIHDNGFYPR
jgi:hypothetical protein